MCEIVEISDDEESASLEIIPKTEALDYNSGPAVDIPSGSSGINLRSSFISMGFSPTRVDRAIQENGQNADLIVEALSAPHVTRYPKAEILDYGLLSGHGDGLTTSFRTREALKRSLSSDSLDSLFDDVDIAENATGSGGLKEEPDIESDVSDEKMVSLLKMNFSMDEVKSALDKHGKDAPLGQLMDFIFASRMAKKYERSGGEESQEDCNEALFGIMEKTLALLDMGFSEHEISTAFETCGSLERDESAASEKNSNCCSKVSVEVLANSIVAPESAVGLSVDKYSSYNSLSSQSYGTPLCRNAGESSRSQLFDPFTIKQEDYSSDVALRGGIAELLEKLKGKRPKIEYTELPVSSRKPKETLKEGANNMLSQAKVGSTSTNNFRKARSSSTSNQLHIPQGSFAYFEGMGEDIKPTIPNSGRTLNSVAAKSPYFLYGNVTKLTQDSWIKISHFLCSILPEFASTQTYSALSRTEGYVHNLPMEDRLHIWPRGPMTLKDALPHTHEWWPSWDTRKHLSDINCESSGVSELCESLGRMLARSRGNLSSEMQRELLQQCEKHNLVWIGNRKLGPLEPEHLERIMGYPLDHTRVAGFSTSDRLKSLKFSFQTDTLGYHLSVLKRQPLFQEGLGVLSFFTGIGGTEVALHRLGIRLKVVVSVEPCEFKRKILKQWWENTGQTGELIQNDNIQKISGKKFEDLVKRFGRFDLVVCQNPYLDVGSDSLRGLDFSLFSEFVRVLQRVRMECKR